MTLGNQIKTARLIAGYNQSWVAHECGVGRLQITKIELGVELPSLFLLKKITDVLEMKDAQRALRSIGI